jgi:putative adenylate-forming enzyme
MTTAVAVDPLAEVRRRVGELLEQQQWPRERMLELQRARLQSLLRHAVERSPYYREVLGSDASDRPLESLPTLPKALFVEQFDRIVTDPALARRELERFVARSSPGDLFAGRYRVFATSGTSGTPGLVVYAPDEFAQWVAVGLARLAIVGVSAETRLAAIGAPGDVHITRQLFAAFQAARADAPRLSVLTPLEETAAELDRYQPEALIAYAGVLGQLADEQLSGRLGIRPRVTIATAEVLTDEVAKRVERAWGATPLNVYAATEAPGIAIASLDRVGMHVCEESVIVEVVDADNRPVPPGEPGSKVLLTNLVNTTQPLIRYELMDSVVVAAGPDPSGRPFLRLERVDGRSDDILELPARGGGTVAVHPFRLRAPFARLTDIRGYQIVHRADGLLVRIVPREESPRTVSEHVRTAVLAALTEANVDVPVRVEIVSTIEREPGHAAKVKLVRSETATRKH